jgi:hypothetical protein
MAHPALEKSYQLIQSGQLEQARPLLVDFLQQNPESAQGWFLMSLAIADRGQQIQCLQRAIRLKPDFSPAQQRLKALSGASQPGTPEGPQRQEEGDQETEMAASDSAPDVTAESNLVSTPVRESKKEEHLTDGASELPASETTAPPANTTPTGAVPRRKKATPRWWTSGWYLVGTIALTITVLGVIAIIIFFSAQGLQNRRAQVAQQVRATAVLGTSIANALPPTWTPGPTPTEESKPTPTTPPTPGEPPPEMSEQMETIQEQVSVLRELEAQDSVPRYLIPEEKVRETLERLVLEGESDLKAEAADQVRVLSVLGLVKPTYDLYTKMLNNQGDSLGGFYIPWNKELYVIGEDFDTLEQFVFSHEYAHALADQHFRIDQAGVSPDCQHDAQQCEAIRALIEGDATLVMYHWLEAHTTEDKQEEIFAYEAPTEIISSADFPPPYVLRENQFRYQDGYNFVEYLYERGTWALVNLAYQDLPESTEQILHPQKFLNGESPIEIPPRPLDEALGDGWRLLDTDRLGELTTYMILGYGIEAIARLDDASAASAAEGWGGDNYQVYYKRSTSEKVLAVHWVWDTPGDAEEFKEAMTTHLNRLFSGVQAEVPGGACWERLNQEIACLYTTKVETLWLKAPNLSVIESVLGLYPEFLN